ncbi:unnamed protein product [Peronospora belbahrii]|uniref:HTH myb-type domain-containing protein n=1 Tax=Peronospora belbahrii TaxID=622444 RepID=A0ABN8CNE3_9STRA|nr:unnamed protein product [Peronospora belbahrii]
MSFGMTERHHVRASDSKIDAKAEEKKTVQHGTEESTPSNDDYNLSSSPIIELDRKDLLIVKDGTVRVAESLEREQLDANGEVVKASGTWTKAEHDRFMRAMETFPKGPWKAVAEMVATRTVRQTQTHAQKYREKLARRMRGLRNRNGTLQTAPMAGMTGYSRRVISPYANMHGPVYLDASAKTGYTSSSMSLARTTSLPAMPLHSLPVHHNHTPYVVSTAVPVSIDLMDFEFSQPSTSTSMSALNEAASYLSSWNVTDVTDVAETKQIVPDFDESMDFLMNVYSTNPSQINMVVPLQSTEMTVTPTACIPRTPHTPMSSIALKRHPGYGSLQQQKNHDKEHFTTVDNHNNNHNYQGEEDVNRL